MDAARPIFIFELIFDKLKFYKKYWNNFEINRPNFMSLKRHKSRCLLCHVIVIDQFNRDD